MRLGQLKTFLAVAEHSSIRGAAKSLFVSQPAVTRTIRELEADMGVPLLVRSTKGVDLTLYGRAMQRRARLVLEESRRIREELDQLKSGAAGSVHIGASALAALTLMPRAFARFRACMPGVALRCMDGQLPIALPELRNGRLDFMLADLMPGAATADLDCELLLRTPQVVVSRPEHPRRQRRRLAALREDDWLGWDPAGVVATFEANGQAPPDRILEIESFILAVGLVAESDALVMFSKAVMRHPLVRGKLHSLPVTDRLPESVVSVITRRGSALTPAAEALLAEMRRSAAQVSENLVRPAAP